MDFVTFEPSDSLHFVKKSNSRNLDGFKIKTTSPHKFCVRPSVGKILPNKKSEISVYIRIHENKKLNSVSSDKFLIQTTVISSDIANLSQEQSIEKIGEEFKKLDKLKKTSPAEVANLLKEHKLLCDISGLPNISIDDSKKAVTLNSSESPKDKSLASPLTPNVASPDKKSRTELNENELLEKNPNNIGEANAIIKELENAIQKYSADSLKNDLVKTGSFISESINDDTTKKINEQTGLLSGWNKKTAEKKLKNSNDNNFYDVSYILI
ncbi:hypothetical protein LY90DRAFT_502093 [Neocallimastix californiae]|uniref:MSP domain-containing protein n=1 Tax=Neocallimastix californiae TaxID=1754190 RepID=A0A1Y2EWN5_9FUNG|nr:hypothetical protein LY90DRAFT_502093 [Neocallimastix californiae]|eukprot:ORY75546.1 hypothetical protein LY90DRAFT_502093 [Neocallimastix californiae]